MIDSSANSGSIIGFGKVSHAGISREESHFPFNLASGITTADIGKAVELDTSAAATVKLATDGGVIIGRLETVESRTMEGTLVGTVAMAGGMVFPFTTAGDVAIGSMVQGSGGGNVKTLAPGATDKYHRSICTEFNNTTKKCVVILF